MTAIKKSSTNQQNKRQNIQCPVTFTLEKIGGRWKIPILFNLREGTRRYSQLKKMIPGITEKMLVQHLRQLEADDMIVRLVKPVVPPHVEYSLSATGESLVPLLNGIAKWGEGQIKKRPFALG